MRLSKKTFLVLSAITIAELNSPADGQEIFRIIPDSGKRYVSPYIYGINALSISNENMAALNKSNLRSERFGGNRATGYNWETNASSAGSDYQHSNDGWMMSSPVPTNNGPAGSIITFIGRCKDYGRYPTVQLQMAGYVAADMAGAVALSETAPSARWKKVLFQKNTPLTLNPITNDSVVYIDELVNFLVSKYGTADNGGVKSYCLDNEPGLWRSTHPRIRPQTVTIDELLQKSGDLAKVIKQIDPTAEIFGFEAWGWMAMKSFSSASGWSAYESTYDWAISAYLDQMKKKSDAFGKRLLDVLSVHWYPEAKGDIRICSTDSGGSENTIQARLQAPRSLWDSTYTENSWIASSIGGPIKLLPRLKASIDKYYPDTKLAVNEFSYGGSRHISGGLALADVFGIFGREGIYNASLHTNFNGFLVPSAMLFVNFDGNLNMYGDTNVTAISPNVSDYSVYASLDSKDSKLIHIICINKKPTDSPVEMSIAGNKQYKSGIVYGFTKDSAAVFKQSDVSSISSNKFSYSLPGYSALHFVLSTDNMVTLPVANLKSLDVSVVGGGKVIKSIEGKMLKNGTSVTLTAVADEDWSFGGWSGADSSKNETITIIMDNNKTIAAQFISEQELIKNGDFSDQMTNWTLSTWSADGTSKGNASVVDEVLKYEIENGGDETWNIQIFQNAIPYSRGITYTLKFEAWADAPHPMYVYAAKGKLNKTVDLTTTKTTFTYQFTADSTDAAGRLSFDLGGGNEESKGTVSIDNVSIKADFSVPVIRHKKDFNSAVVKEFSITIGSRQKIKLLSQVAGGPISLSICNLSGRSLISIPYLNVQTQAAGSVININKNLAQGMYLVRIKALNSVISEKIMVW